MDTVVHLRGAVSLLGRFPALAGVDLDVAAGEIVLLHGPNGAGKTTLLRLCAGLLPVARGEAAVLGHDLRDLGSARLLRRRVGLLAHETGLYDDLTVVDNVRFWGRAAGADSRRDRGCGRSARPCRAPRRLTRRSPVRRAAATHLVRLPSGPPPRAVAARRAPRRSRPGRPRPRRRPGRDRRSPPAQPSCSRRTSSTGPKRWLGEP